MSRERVLIIEDDKAIVQFMSRAIEGAGFACTAANTAAQARIAFFSENPDVVILDLGLPDEDGMRVLTDLKKYSYHTPVIIVSARERESEKVRAFEQGADDYVTKPFGIFELIARIKAAIRHVSDNRTTSDVQDVFVLNDLSMDVVQHKVCLAGEEIHLTTKEFRILELLFRNQGKLLTHAWLMQQVWGNYVPDNNQVLRVNMANIRRKLREDINHPKYIKTELGVGYRLLD